MSKNIIYIICFLLVLVIPPFGIAFGLIMILVTSLDNHTHKEAEALRQREIARDEAAISAAARKPYVLTESQQRNLERNTQIKTDPNESEDDWTDF